MDLDKTVRFRNVSIQTGQYSVTIFDATCQPYTVQLADDKTMISFGRAEDNDLVLTSHLVSRHHGRFVQDSGKWYMEDLGSTNGMIYNNTNIRRKEIGDGDLIRIDDGVEAVANGVLFIFSNTTSTNKWNSVSTENVPSITIGRDANCTIVLPHISVSQRHAGIQKEQEHYCIIDNGSANGLFVNGVRVTKKAILHEKDVITITNSKLIFTTAAIFYCCCKSGLSVDSSDVVIKRGKGKRSFVTCNHVNLNIKPGELVAIIGGSGAGKSTILNAMCGYLEPAEGAVYINGIDLYHNFDSLKKIIGYVPQSDIVYDNLSLYDMLSYTSKLRMPKDISAQEREAAITRAIDMVELSHKRDSLIGALSGGQRKRASIAVELLSDPNLLFLDEPASGLDPGTERNLMQSLRKMADGGKTVVLVTHSTLQLQLCDKIVFMGAGGNLCFYGSHDEALKFFGVDSVVDVYNMITYQTQEWSEKYAQLAGPASPFKKVTHVPTKNPEDRKRQLRVLCSRYVKLILNDKQRLWLLLLQAPLLAFLISMVADGEQFEAYEMTKSLLFALSCCAFWVGILNAIQEICKERTILKREYMTGLSLGTYVLSKIIVLGTMCLLQCLMIVVVFAALVGLPESGVILPSPIELLISIFLTALSAAALGLFVSSLFDNADRAMTVAPILLMPQILFSGQLFKLEGVTSAISWFATCRWSMESLGSTADLNELPNKMGVSVFEDFYDTDPSHLLRVWGILLLSIVVFLFLSKRMLRKLGKKQ